MTTIAYKDGVLAADTACRAGWLIEGSVVKIVRAGPILAAACGGSALCERFLDWVRRGCRGEPPDMGAADAKEAWQATGLLFLPDQAVIRFDPALPPLAVLAPIYAAGSGRDVALGAMHAGAPAARAVQIAILLDGGSGGYVLTTERGRAP